MIVKGYKNGKLVSKELALEELAQMQAEQEAAEREYWVSVDYAEAVNSKIRERYTDSHEFAILRQRDEKPEEYAEYYAYCEDCKAYVKGKKGMHMEVS